jgi:hypothetical protein
MHAQVTRKLRSDPRQAVKPFAEVHKVNYGTEICGVAAGSNSLRKRS